MVIQAPYKRQVFVIIDRSRLRVFVRPCRFAKPTVFMLSPQWHNSILKSKYKTCGGILFSYTTASSESLIVTVIVNKSNLTSKMVMGIRFFPSMFTFHATLKASRPTFILARISHYHWFCRNHPGQHSRKMRYSTTSTHREITKLSVNILKRPAFRQPLVEQTYDSWSSSHHAYAIVVRSINSRVVETALYLLL